MQDLTPPASPNLFDLSSIIEWSQCADLPKGVKLGSVVVLDGKLYWGGGEVSQGGTTIPDRHVRVFDLARCQRWDYLPDHPYSYFTVAVYGNALVAVGGWDNATNNATDQVLLWDATSSSWTKSQPMLTSRSESSAVGYNQFLAVAGGWNGSTVINVVEVFDGDCQAWVRAPHLPVPAKMCKTAFHDGYWYLIGGDSYSTHVSVNRASMDEMIASVKAMRQRRQQRTAVWSTLTDLPVKSSPLAIWGCTLVALGGTSKEPSNTVIRSSKIHAYCPHTNSWHHIGDMPTKGSAHCAVTLPTGELLIVGGRTDITNSVKEVFKARLISNRK